jgi:hypothetical protein
MHIRHITLLEKPCFHDERAHFDRAPITVHFGRLLARTEIPYFGESGMRKGLQTLEFSFEAESLTHFGGLFLIQRFCNKLCLRRRLERILRAAPRWTEYHPADLILVFLYVLIAGLPRVNKTEILQYNGLFRSLVGLKSFPDQTSLRRFLRRLSLLRPSDKLPNCMIK